MNANYNAYLLSNRVTGKYWNGAGFRAKHLHAASLVDAAQAAVIRATYDNVVGGPVRWAPYVASFVRSVREHGEDGVRYYLFLHSPGYCTQGHALTRFTDCNGKVSVRSKYTLQDIRGTAKHFDELADLAAKAAA